MSNLLYQYKKYESHHPVMLQEVIHYMNIQGNENCLDCTFGAGGYSRAILETSNAMLYSIDQDPNVEQYAMELMQHYPERFRLVLANFADASKVFNHKFDSIVLDLGVSSMQIDEGHRGFSFLNDGPLDMRMNCSGTSAADFINQAREEDIANIIYKYGEETQSRRIANKIVEERSKNPILTTSRLAHIVRSAKRFERTKIDPATKTFQAIRIHINGEIQALESFLSELKNILNIGGRIVVVSFHSLEDALVKAYFRDYSRKKVAVSKYAKTEPVQDENKWLETLTHKALVPSKDEVSINVRSRSAKLRAAKRIY